MIVRFFSNYDSSEGLVRRFFANYAVCDAELNFTIGSDYDYAVVFNRTDEFIIPGKKVITIIQEPSWNIVHRNTDFLRKSDYLIIHDAQLFEKTHQIKLGGKVIESPAYMFYHDHIDQSFYERASATPKTRKLSIIVSYLNKPFGIYQKRYALLTKILESDLDIDIYGWRLEFDDPRFKGYLDYKFTGLLPYEYSIAIENSSEKNYISEKFVDCVLCDTVPIYYGAPNVAEVYDSRYFKTIDLDSPTIIEDLKDLIAEPALVSTVNKSIYLNQLNLYTKLKEVIREDRGIYIEK